MLACNIAEKAARGAFAISSMAADTKTKDDWPLLLPLPPKFNVPPTPFQPFLRPDQSTFVINAQIFIVGMHVGM